MPTCVETLVIDVVAVGAASLTVMAAQMRGRDWHCIRAEAGVRPVKVAGRGVERRACGEGEAGDACQLVAYGVAWIGRRAGQEMQCGAFVQGHRGGRAGLEDRRRGIHLAARGDDATLRLDGHLLLYGRGQRGFIDHVLAVTGLHGGLAGECAREGDVIIAGAGHERVDTIARTANQCVADTRAGLRVRCGKAVQK